MRFIERPNWRWTVRVSDEQKCFSPDVCGSCHQSDGLQEEGNVAGLPADAVMVFQALAEGLQILLGKT